MAAHVATLIKVVAPSSSWPYPVEAHRADIVMVDAPTPGGGVPFDWSSVGDFASRHRLLLAGGLDADNVGEAVRRVGPWGVDVASGVESSPGHKDVEKIARFVRAARATSQAPAPPEPGPDVSGS